MAQRINIPFPANGLSDIQSFGDQQIGTSREAKNVRAFDPATGRNRGGQRPGTTAFASAAVNGANKIQAISSVSVHNPRTTYAQRDSFVVNESVWKKLTASSGTIVGLDTDRQSNVYALDNSGVVYKYSEDGELIGQQSVAAVSHLNMSHQLVVDALGGVYVGGGGLPEGEFGEIVRLHWEQRTEDDGYFTETYRIPLPGTPVDFQVRGDRLSVLVSAKADAVTTSSLHQFAFIFSQSPVQLWDRMVPTPSNNLAVNNQGNVFIAAEDNSNRDPDNTNDGAFTTVAVDWVPNHLANSQKRIFKWIDASRVFEPSGFPFMDGDPIMTARDRRKDDTTDAITDPAAGYYNSDAGPFTPPENNFGITAQHLFSSTPGGGGDDPDSGSGLVHKPDTAKLGFYQFGKTAGAGINAYGVGIRFDRNNYNIAAGPNTDLVPFKGSALFPSVNQATGDNAAPTATTSAILTKHRSFVPGWAGASWTMCMVVKFDHENKVGCLFAHNVGDIKIAIYSNCTGTPDFSSNLGGVDDSTTFASTKSLRVVVDTGSGHVNAGTGGDYSGASVSGNGGSVTTTHLSSDNDCKSAVIVIHMGNPDGGLTGSANAGNVNTVRVNGVACYEFKASAATNGQSTGPARSALGQTIIDNEHWNTTTGNVHDNPAGSPHSFVGTLAEYLVVLPNTSSTLFDTPTTAPCGVNWYVNPTLGTHGVGSAEAVAHASASSESGATEVEKLEGYLAHKWGIGHLLPNQSGASDKDAGSNYWKNHPFGGVGNHPYRGSGVSGFGSRASENAIISSDPIVAKYDGNSGEIVWATALDGMGYGIAVDHENGVFSVGTDPDAAADSETGIIARRIEDTGTGVTTTGGTTWTLTSGTAGTSFDDDHYEVQVTGNKYTRLIVDSRGDLYWPRALTAASGKTAQVLKITGKTFTGVAGGGANTGGTIAWKYQLDDALDAYTVALPMTQPGYGFANVTGPEFMFVGSSYHADDPTNVRKVRLVTATRNNGSAQYSPRTTTHIAISNGAIKQFSKSNSPNSIYSDIATHLDGDANSSSNADEQIDTGSDYVSAVPLHGKIWITDGENFRYFRPPLTGQTGTAQYGTISEWKAKDGEMPKRPKLMVGWRGRIVMARTADDAFNWHMSKMGDPEDWNYYPDVIIPTQAVSGASSRFGKSPDLINALVPYSDDLLIIGGDSTIQRLTGDPMSGGQLDLVSDATGMAFGNSWCRGPQGSIFFFGSRGGVYAMAPQGGVEQISVNSIERRLKEVDLTKFKVELTWDNMENGLHVFLLPYGAVSSSAADWATHYFWDSRNNAWFEDTFTGQANQVTAVHTVDGDTATDRHLILGCGTGLLNFWDKDSVSDMGTAIESEVLIGPMAPGDAATSMRWSRLECSLANDQGGARFEIMANDEPDTVGDIIASGSLQAGSNPIQPVRAKGRCVWVRLRNRAAGERWALEDLAMTASVSGRKRVRP